MGGLRRDQASRAGTSRRGTEISCAYSVLTIIGWASIAPASVNCRMTPDLGDGTIKVTAADHDGIKFGLYTTHRLARMRLGKRHVGDNPGHDERGVMARDMPKSSLIGCTSWSREWLPPRAMEY